MTQNKAIESARMRGAAAYREGSAITANPYGDARTYNGGVTFARAFWRAWRDGWERAHIAEAAVAADRIMRED